VLSFRFLAPAERDAREAARFYESVAPGQEVAFRASLQQGLDSVRRHPSLGRVVDVGLRAIVLDRFPFKVLYRVKADVIVVVAVAHDRRRPGYWK